MKTKSLLSLGAMSLATVAFAQSTYTDLYYTGGFVNAYYSAGGHLVNAGSYSVGSLEGPTYTGNVDENCNIFISVANGQRLSVNEAISAGTFSIHDYNVTGVNTGGSGNSYSATWNQNGKTGWVTTIQVADRKTLNITGDFVGNFETNTTLMSKGQDTYTRIELAANAVINIAGDMHIYNNTTPVKPEGSSNTNIRNNGLNFLIYGEPMIKEDNVRGESYFNLGGDVYMYDKNITAAYWGATPTNRVTLSFNVLSATIGGVIHMDEDYYDGERVLDLQTKLMDYADNAATYDVYFDDVSRSFGGIDGSGIIKVGAERAKNIALSFTNATNSAWIGSLTSGNADTKINVLMNGEGKQSMIIKETHEGEGRKVPDTLNGGGLRDIAFYTEMDNKIGFNSVDVQKGTFELGGYAELKHGSLKVSSSNAKFVVGGYQADTLGTVNFEAARITAGTIGISFNQEASDVLNFATSGEYALGDGFTAGKFHVSNPSSLTIELDYLPVEGSDIKEQLADLGGSMEWEIMYFESTNLTEETISDIIVKVVDQSGNVIDGVDATLSLLGEADSYYGISATITSAVPEPATVAGIAGLLALAFAAYRRRR